MGSYENEAAMVEAGTATRGHTMRMYFEEVDAGLTDETSHLKHRPDYSRSLLAPENDDIYREFCRYVDMEEPRFFDKVEDPISVEGHTAADVYLAMISHNDRIVAIDGAAVYAMLANLRKNSELYSKVLDFRPTCYQSGCGMKDAAFDAGYYGERRFPKA